MASHDLFGNLIADGFTREVTSRKIAPARNARRDPLRFWGSDTGLLIDPTLRGLEGDALVKRLGADRSRAKHDAAYLTRKAARAVPFGEGMREITGEPDRARVGLLQIAVQMEGK